MELWDIYDINKEKTGKVIDRHGDEKLKDGEYHLVVEAIIINSKGEIFYYKRESNWFFELVCEKIAELLGIKAVCHIFYKYNSMPGLISMDFHKKGYNYIDGEELIKNYFSKHPEDTVA